MARIRIFLLTCGRPALFPRALQSLRAQTFRDWVCEVHNDLPADDAPRRLVAEARDARLEFHEHDRQWGPIAVFNHAYRGGPEPFLSILEDDNWWEPTLLERLLQVLDAHPSAALAWANMRIWQEKFDGSWSPTGQTVWQLAGPAQPVVFAQPAVLQAVDALHSIGAMLCRREHSARALVPPSTPFAINEPVRERLINAPMVLVPEPLAHFAHTLRSARPDDRRLWVQSQLLVAESFFRRANPDAAGVRELWRSQRRSKPRATSALLLACLTGAAPLRHLRHATLADWWHFIRGTVRRPGVTCSAFRFRTALRECRDNLSAAPADNRSDVLPLAAKRAPTPGSSAPR